MRIFLIALSLLFVCEARADWLKVMITSKCAPRVNWCADLPTEIRDASAVIPTDRNGNPLTLDIIVFVSPKIDTSKITLKPGSERLNKGQATAEIKSRDPKANPDTIEKQP